MRVLLVDDHPLFREALATVIGQQRPDATVEQFETAGQVAASLNGPEPADLVLLDLHLPDNAGMMGLVGLKAQHPELSIAIVSGRDDRQTVATARACGASGYIAKTAPPAALAAALSALMAGQSWFPADVGAGDGGGGDGGGVANRLSAMQMRVLDGIKRGKMNKQIAFEVGLSEHAVKYHLAGIFRKLSCQTRAQLVAAVANEIMEP